MKRFILFAALVLMGAGAAMAQCGNIPANQITVTPAVYTAEDMITVTIDASGTCIAADNVTAMDLWMFSPGCCGAPTNNGFCGDGTPEPLATNLGGNRFSYTFRMTDVLQRPAGDISSFGIIFKAADRNPCSGAGGNRQTQDIILTPQPLTYTERLARLFPRLCTDEDVVTLFVNRALSDNTSIQTDDSLYVYAFADVLPAGGGSTFFKQVSNFGDVFNRADLKLSYGGVNNQFLRFIPRVLFTLNPGERLTNIKFVIRGKVTGAQHNGDQIFPLQTP